MGFIFEILILMCFLVTAYLTFKDNSTQIFSKASLDDKYKFSLLFFGIPSTIIRKEINKSENPDDVIAALKKCLRFRRIRFWLVASIILALVLNGLI